MAKNGISKDSDQIENVFRHKHILDLDDFSQEEINLVLNTTEAMEEILTRPIKKVPTLRGKTVINFFYEPSTRTRASFELAAKNLSADVVNISGVSSSATKGENLRDSLATIESIGANFIVIRHASSGAPYLATRYVSAIVINAGDGWHAHPTQALLDLYTIRKHKSSFAGLKVAIIGDIKHSRVARSNIWGLTTMGASVTLCAPGSLLPYGLNQDSSVYPDVTVTNNINEALCGADVVMALRLQKERQDKGLFSSIREFIQRFQLTFDRLMLAKSDAIVMHPGPVNEGIEIAPEIVYGTKSVIAEQVKNGVAIRMALLYLLSGRQINE
jgi:aspartate carbamoyltransferase catalytic subunit